MKINWGNNNITVGKMPAKITVEHMFKDTLWHPVSFIKRALFDKLGLYNETYKIVADYDFFFKAIVINKVSLKYINSVVSEYNTEGLSSNPNNREIEKDERKRVLNSYLSSEEIEKLEKGMNKNKLISFFKHFLKGK
jgi:hypothetical protein